MGFIYGFQSDKLYGVDDINNIVSNFTSAGVSTYEDLNGISGALTGAGVTIAVDSCKVTVTEDSQLKILPGVAFFYDGSTVTIDSSGVLLEPNRYVYLKKDSDLNTGYPVSSAEAPGIYDIPLAEYRNGILTDKRPRAVSKIEGFGERTHSYNYIDISGAAPSEGVFTTIYTFEDIDTNYRYVMISDDSDTENKTFLGWGNMGSQKYWSASMDENNENMCFDFGGDQIVLYNSGNSYIKQIKFVKNGVNIELQYRTYGIDDKTDLHLHVRFS